MPEKYLFEKTNQGTMVLHIAVMAKNPKAIDTLLENLNNEEQEKLLIAMH